jgi:small subunit ribosomal protein S6
MLKNSVVLEVKIPVTQYETLFLVHPEKGGKVKEYVEKFKKVIEGQEGSLAQVEEWGMRDLAYRIQKQGKGFYTLLRYRATGRAVEELERNLKLTDGILRYLTVSAEAESQPAADAAPKSHGDEAGKPPAVESAKSEPQT